MHDKHYYEKLFKDYPDVVDLTTFRKMLGGIWDCAARRLMKKIGQNISMDKVMQGRKIDYFSSTGEHMRKPVKLKWANIYIETNLSANQIRNIVAKLLRLCNLSITDYNIFFRADYTSLHE